MPCRSFAFPTTSSLQWCIVSIARFDIFCEPVSLTIFLWLFRTSRFKYWTVHCQWSAEFCKFQWKDSPCWKLLIANCIKISEGVVSQAFRNFNLLSQLIEREDIIFPSNSHINVWSIPNGASLPTQSRPSCDRPTHFHKESLPFAWSCRPNWDATSPASSGYRTIGSGCRR
jgi:hypothetical protein